MEIRLGNPYPAGALSNLAPHPFTFRGVECGSMEGLLQGVKFEAVEMQKHVCSLAGHKARLAGKNKNWFTTQTLWWQGEAINRQSDEYQELITKAYDTMFKQSDSFRRALTASGDSNLTHKMGRNKPAETVLTTQEFISRLNACRKKLKAKLF